MSSTKKPFGVQGRASLKKVDSDRRAKPAELPSRHYSMRQGPLVHELQHIGKYRIIKTIGKGNFAKVKLAKHIPTGRQVAIKVIDKTLLSSTSKAKLWREVRIMKTLDHPNIVKLYQVMETERHLYLVMEYASGGELFDYLTSRGRMKEKDARAKFRQILSAVHYIHQKNIVHRDLKAENLLLDRHLNIKIADFGFSNEFCPSSKLDTFCGSPPYAAPELFLGKRYVGPEVDVWSIGVILFTLTTGSLPFDGSNLKELREKIVKGKFKVPFFLSTECELLLKKLLVTNSSKRITLETAMKDKWCNQTYEDQLKPYRQSPHCINHERLDYMQSLGYQKDEVGNSLRMHLYDDAMATYLLLAISALNNTATHTWSNVSIGRSNTTISSNHTKLTAGPKNNNKNYKTHYYNNMPTRVVSINNNNNNNHNNNKKDSDVGSVDNKYNNTGSKYYGNANFNIENNSKNNDKLFEKPEKTLKNNVETYYYSYNSYGIMGKDNKNKRVNSPFTDRNWDPPKQSAITTANSIISSTNLANETHNNNKETKCNKGFFDKLKDFGKNNRIKNKNSTFNESTNRNNMQKTTDINTTTSFVINTPFKSNSIVPNKIAFNRHLETNLSLKRMIVTDQGLEKIRKDVDYSAYCKRDVKRNFEETVSVVKSADDNGRDGSYCLNDTYNNEYIKNSISEEKDDMITQSKRISKESLDNSLSDNDKRVKTYETEPSRKLVSFRTPLKNVITSQSSTNQKFGRKKTNFTANILTPNKSLVAVTVHLKTPSLKNNSTSPSTTTLPIIPFILSDSASSISSITSVASVGKSLFESGLEECKERKATLAGAGATHVFIPWKSSFAEQKESQRASTYKYNLDSTNVQSQYNNSIINKNYNIKNVVDNLERKNDIEKNRENAQKSVIFSSMAGKESNFDVVKSKQIITNLPICPLNRAITSKCNTNCNNTSNNIRMDNNSTDKSLNNSIANNLKMSTRKNITNSCSFIKDMNSGSFRSENDYIHNNVISEQDESSQNKEVVRGRKVKLTDDMFRKVDSTNEETYNGDKFDNEDDSEDSDNEGDVEDGYNEGDVEDVDNEGDIEDGDSSGVILKENISCKEALLNSFPDQQLQNIVIAKSICKNQQTQQIQPSEQPKFKKQSEASSQDFKIHYENFLQKNLTPETQNLLQQQQQENNQHYQQQKRLQQQEQKLQNLFKSQLEQQKQSRITPSFTPIQQRQSHQQILSPTKSPSNPLALTRNVFLRRTVHGATVHDRKVNTNKFLNNSKLSNNKKDNKELFGSACDAMRLGWEEENEKKKSKMGRSGRFSFLNKLASKLTKNK